jgi:hypothetical protein
MELFLQSLSGKTKKKSKLPDLFNHIGVDNDFSQTIKKAALKEFKDYFNWISNRVAHQFSYHNFLCADQLIHFCGLNTTEKSFLLLNSGLPNVLHIVQGGKVNRAKDVGQPFFSIIITQDVLKWPAIFGRVKTYRSWSKSKMIYVNITNWRRLQVHKLALIRDQYFQALSCSFDSFSRQKPYIDQHNINDAIRNVYSMKVAVGSCPSQRVAEFLMDVRYVLMACFSDYTSVHELIKEKFAPHYPNAFTRWIVAQLQTKSIQIMTEFNPSQDFQANMPIFKGEQRLLNSIGGTVNMPSIWSNFRTHNMQDLFDDLFVYVLTGKEPSS